MIGFIFHFKLRLNIMQHINQISQGNYKTFKFEIVMDSPSGLRWCVAGSFWFDANRTQNRL